MNIDFQLINLYQCERGFVTSTRYLNHSYILYVHRGKGKYKIGNTEYTAEAGDIFYCPVMIPNIIIADENDPFLLSGIEFYFGEGDSWIENSIPEKSNILSESFWISLINEMITECSYNKAEYKKICGELLSSLCIHLSRINNMGIASDHDISGELLDYIKNNSGREITHEEISSIFHYHKNTINTIVKKSTGMTLKSYQIELRLKKAISLLTYSSKSITEISELCGYTNSAFFARQFKEKMGVTPLDYRRIISKN